MKTLYIISGANGSGKTTFAKEFSKINELYFINADEIAKELDSKNITKYKIKAGKMFFCEFKSRLSLDKSFVTETTLSGKYLVEYIQKAKELGFHISLIYLFLENPQTNINRVKNRVLNGGHHIPKDDIIRRYYRSKNMFWNIYKDLCDTWSIYYNSDEVFEEIADKSQIFDEIKYNEFLKDIDAND
ncbi:MAG: AAA family ATPase [Sulfurimonadaceae bacterium]